MSTPSFRVPSSRLVAILATAISLAACNGAASPPAGSAANPSAVASAAPSTLPSASAEPTVGAIDHATGATDVVLRLDSSGGFAPMELIASQAPIFTLYGNGIVVFQPKATTVPEPDQAGITHQLPWRAARLDEDQIQKLLEFALGPGGLGTARDSYLEGGLADVPNTLFTVRAGGVDKTVVVSGLVEAGNAGADAGARAAFAKLADRLRDFDQGGSISTDVYQPPTYRGILTPRDPDPAVTPLAWPWPSVKPADFKEGVADASGGIVLPHRSMTGPEVDALGVKDAVGGLQNVVLKAPDGKTYGLTIRPLLPDETE